MATVITRVFIICNAYESGYGHGLERDELPNPYSEGSEEHEAYAIGYNAGATAAARRAFNFFC